jgi:hypothetical protein
VSRQVEWLPGPTSRLLNGVRHLKTQMLICEGVWSFARAPESFTGRAERVEGAPHALRLFVAGHRVLVDIDETTVTVTGLYYDPRG